MPLSHRDRQRQEQRRKQAAGWKRSEDNSAHPERYYNKSLEQPLPAATGALYVRASKGEQDIKLQEKAILWLLAKEGIKIPKERIYRDTGSAKAEEFNWGHRPQLFKAFADLSGTGIPLFMPGTTRAIRSNAYHPSQNPYAVPTKKEFEKFVKAAKGVNVIFINNPAATPPEDEAFLKKLYADYRNRPTLKERKKYKGWTKDRERECGEKVIRWREQGMSYGKIAHLIYLNTGFEITRDGARKMVKRLEALLLTH